MGITIEEANARLNKILRSGDKDSEYFVGPIEKRRIKEQDHLLEVLSDPDSLETE